MSAILIFVLLGIIGFVLWLKSERRIRVKESKQRRFFAEGDLQIAGVKYSKNIEEIRNTKKGTTLLFIREEDNPHDWNAIKVCDSEGKKWGYIPKDLAFWLSHFMDHNHVKIQAKVKKIYISEEPIVILHLTLSVFQPFAPYWEILISEMKKWNAYAIETETDIQNYEKGSEKLKKGFSKEALILFEKVSFPSPLYEKAQEKAKQIERNERLGTIKKLICLLKALVSQKSEENYKQGLIEFKNKNFEKVIELMSQICVDSVYYREAQRKIEKVGNEIKERQRKWQKIIEKIEVLNSKTRGFDREIQLAFKAIEDGYGSNIIEKLEKSKNLKRQIINLLKQAEKILPLKTKEFWKSKIRQKKQREEQEKRMREMYRPGQIIGPYY